MNDMTPNKLPRMPENNQFTCGTPKCGYSLATEGMNKVKLEALRRWPKTCPRCKKLTKWTEQVPLLNTKTLQTLADGGSPYETTTQERNRQASNSRRRQRAADDRGAGLH